MIEEYCKWEMKNEKLEMKMEMRNENRVMN